VVRQAERLGAIDAEERRGDRPRPGLSRAEARVRLASAVTQEMLLDLFPGALHYDTALGWNTSAERVEATERLLYEDLVLEESRATSWPRSLRWTWPGTNWVNELTTAMIGLPKSSFFMPVARQSPRAPAMLRPWVVVLDR
jgi:hypothetical protein